MKIKDRFTVTRKCRLCLPDFFAEDGDDADAVSLMNTFCKRLEEEIISYSENESEHIRLYTSEYTAWEEKFRYIRIRLSARKSTVGGSVNVLRRELYCKWHGTRLVEFKAVDL